jgi:putative acetyltransferase
LAFEFQIRRAEPEDAFAIAKVLHDAFVEFETLYTPEGFAATTPNSLQIVVRMKEGPVWIALRREQALASVAAIAKGDSAYIRGMAVVPPARGLGMGVRLLAVVEQWAIEQGCSRIFLSTTPFLHAAIRLYEKQGFRQTPEGPRNLFGTPLFTMERKIPRQEH